MNGERMESRFETDDYKNRKAVLHMQEAEVPSFKARLAAAMIEKWGSVACEVDGEDSSGRQKVRRLTPSELVDGAVETADLAVEAFRAKGWMHQLPSFADKDAFLAGDTSDE